ncbi:MAG: carbohydrate kinase family protein [Anaerolineales bacterium]|nr:carbohydrate kinase family protein [Anaerolineales bacterium]MDW8161570.1 carbohydrate kinase family protein [Anaerolineales bacterium]
MSPSPYAVFAGRLQREFVLLPDGRAFEDQMGGNALYSAVGWLLWQQDQPAGILAKVGEDYPQEWLQQISQKGIDIRGIRVANRQIDLRAFYAYTDSESFTEEDAILHYARHRLPFPRTLLGYRPSPPSLDSRTQTQPFSLRSTDLPREYLEARAAHLAPVDYLTHNLLPTLLRQGLVTTLTLSPSPGYMHPSFWSEIPQVLHGLTAFLPSEKDLRSLFKERTQDIWEMIEELGEFVEIIAVRTGGLGQLVYDALGRKRWFVPSYPARTVTLHGTADVFCGGFLAGFCQTFDPLESALYGHVAASIASEGIGVFYALDCEPRLPRARLEALRQAVRKL